MPDYSKPEAQAVWQQQSEHMLLAALGRAEHRLVNGPLSAPLFRGLTGAQMNVIRVAMLASVTEVKDVLMQCAWMVEDPPADDLLPLDVLEHAAQARAVYKATGLIK